MRKAVKGEGREKRNSIRQFLDPGLQNLRKSSRLKKQYWMPSYGSLVVLDISDIQKHIRKLRRAVKRARKPSSPDDVHKLRTRARRVMAAVGAISVLPDRRAKALIRKLGRIRKKAGRVRDMDVLTAHLATVRADREQNCFLQLLEYLGAERYRQAERLCDLARLCGAKVRRQLKRLDSRLQTLSQRPDRRQPKTEQEQAVAKALRLSSELAAPARLSRRNLHDYRLKIKELRYVLQMADRPSDEKLLTALGESKDAIGEWHDWEELVGIADEILEHGRNCKLKRQLKTISDRKFDHALAVAQKIPPLKARRQNRQSLS
jgi:CHAD domain-containing protein